ncbi:disintegrin and metalloproteinase domain-containing protein 10-like [Centruroides sculpturatus]|uniref:disintegrin and metalloproteinase domain-containing protein 10-like n=1 Tax=Centruroides sculpturatus TaxID=218467 RepID=UPI000C6D3FA1|nr:disintegrin and metalloproteinase domain-containing protein 10-like [Centruroides sculpturatus]
MHFIRYLFALDFVIYLKLDSFLSEESSIYQLQSDVYSVQGNLIDVVSYEFSENNDTFFNVSFFVFGKGINLYLHKDESILSSTAEVLLYNDDKVKKMYLRSLSGAYVLKGTVNNWIQSSAIGYFNKRGFVGRFSMDNEIFYLEPTDESFIYDPSFKDKKTSFVYKLNDVIINDLFKEKINYCEEMDERNSTESYSSKRHHNCTDSEMYNPMLLTDKTRFERRCSLQLLADPTYLKRNNYNYETTIADMLYYVTIADLIFRNMDLDEDGNPDGVGFYVEKIMIFQNETVPGYPLHKTGLSDYGDFLKSLSYYNHYYCMMVYFCIRDFWIESHCSFKKLNKLGGICEEDSVNNCEMRRNVAYVTYLERQKEIPRFRVALNLAHQLGHAFGCVDDPPESKLCTPEENGGNYIMHSYVPFGTRSNNWKFSACCTRTVAEYMKMHDKCLRKIGKSTCGNGIIEKDEDCDCDYYGQECKFSECCIPKDLPFECTFKETCSPQTAECCDNSCNISVDKNRTCFSNIICFDASSTCNGDSPFCSGTLQPDGTVCSRSYQTCLNGMCTSDICNDHGLELCQCSSKDEQCYICCKLKSGICKPAKSFNISTSDGHLYLKMEGILCDQNRGICLRNGTCLTKKAIKVENDSYGIWYYPSLIFFLILVIVALYCIPRDKEKSKSIKCLENQQICAGEGSNERNKHAAEKKYEIDEKQDMFYYDTEVDDRNILKRKKKCIVQTLPKK